MVRYGPVTDVDLAAATGLVPRFSRAYVGGSPGGLLGDGWWTIFDVTLTVDQEQHGSVLFDIARLRGPTGGITTFHRKNGTSDDWMSAPGSTARLEEDGNDLLVRWSSGETWHFVDSDDRLVGISDRLYDGAGAGVYLSFDYGATAWRITEEHTDRYLELEYVGGGPPDYEWRLYAGDASEPTSAVLLRRFVTDEPLTSDRRLVSVHEADGQIEERYEYEQTALGLLLTDVYDGQNVLLEMHEYDSNPVRAIRAVGRSWNFAVSYSGDLSTGSASADVHHYVTDDQTADGVAAIDFTNAGIITGTTGACGCGAATNDWNDDFMPEKMTDAEGHEVTYAYDLEGRPHLVTRIEDADGWTEYEYHPDYDLVTRRIRPGRLGGGDPDHRWTERFYDGAVLEREIRHGYTHDETGTVVLQVQEIEYVFDARGRLLEKHGPGDEVEMRFYYADDHAVMENRGRLEAVMRLVDEYWIGTWHVGEPLSDTAYDVYGNPVWSVTMVVDDQWQIEAHQIVEFDWDDHGRLTTRREFEEWDPNLQNHVTAETTYTYWSGDRIHTVTSPSGITTVTTYGDYGRVESVARFASNVDPFGQGAEPFEAVLYDHDHAGNVILEQHVEWVASQPEVRFEVQREFGVNGRLIKEIHPELGSNVYREMTYDAMGRIESETDELGRTTTFERDDHGRIERVRQPEIEVDSTPVEPETEYSYNDSGQVTSVTDANGLVTSYLYDDFDRLIEVETPDSGITRYTWDVSGHLVQREDAEGRTLGFSYDLVGRLTEIIDLTGSPVVLHELRYDEGYGQDSFGAGHLTSMDAAAQTVTFEYDRRGRIVAEHTEIGTVSYAWDLDGGLVEMVYPGGLEVEYVRGPDGRVEKVVASGPMAPIDILEDVEYEPMGPIRAYTRGNLLTRSVDRNLRGEITSVADLGLDWTQVDWTETGVPERIVDAGLDEDRIFTHDALERLTRVERDATGGISELEFALDATGNRLMRDEDGKYDAYTYETGTNRLDHVLDPPPPEEEPTREGLQESWLALLYGLEVIVEADGAGGESFAAMMSGLPEYSPMGGLWLEEVRRFLRHFRLERAMVYHVALALGGPTFREKMATFRRYREEEGGWYLSRREKELLLEMIRDLQSLDVASAILWLEDAGRTSLASSEDEDEGGFMAMSSGGGTDLQWKFYTDDAGYVTEIASFVTEDPGGGAPLETHQTSACLYYNVLGQLDQIRSEEDDGGPTPSPLCPSEPVGSTQNIYDARARRSQSAGMFGAVNRFVYDLNDRLLVEENEIGSVFGPSTKYIRRSRIYLGPELVARVDVEVDTSGQEPVETYVGTWWYSVDHLGTPWSLTNESGEVAWRAHYTDPFGGPEIDGDANNNQETVSERMRLPGQYDDGDLSIIGLAGPYYNWHRYYVPRFGRYLSEDPLIVAPTGSHGGLLPYVYAVHSPMAVVDPSGLQPVPIKPRSALTSPIQCPREYQDLRRCQECCTHWRRVCESTGRMSTDLCRQEETMCFGACNDHARNVCQMPL